VPSATRRRETPGGPEPSATSRHRKRVSAWNSRPPLASFAAAPPFGRRSLAQSIGNQRQRDEGRDDDGSRASVIANSWKSRPTHVAHEEKRGSAPPAARRSAENDGEADLRRALDCRVVGGCRPPRGSGRCSRSPRSRRRRRSRWPPSAPISDKLSRLKPKLIHDRQRPRRATAAPRGSG